jgi:2'-5' RNA ligase
MARLRPLDTDVVDKTATAFEDHVVEVLRRVADTAAERLGGTAAEVHPSAVSADDLGVIRARWLAAVDAEVLPALAEVYGQASALTRAALASAGRALTAAAGGPQFGPSDLATPDPAAFLADARNRVGRLGDDLWQEARGQLVEGVQAQEDIGQLASRVRSAAGLAEARARVVARTEVLSANNAASLAQVRALHDPSVTKEWLATLDHRTRESHRIADGQQVPVDERFTVGGALLDHPGDPDGPAAEVSSCRCSLAFDVGAEPAEEPAEEPLEPPAGGPGTGRDLTTSVDWDAETSHVVEARTIFEAEDDRDHKFVVIARKQGFDAPPRVVDAGTMDGLVAEGHQEIFRGVSVQAAQRLATGDYEGISGVLGAGYYTSTSRAFAEGYANHYVGGEGVVQRMVLDKAARVISYRHAGKELDTLRDSGSVSEVLAADEGRWAAAKGYDAMFKKRSDGSTWYVVFNRAALIVEELPMTAAATAPERAAVPLTAAADVQTGAMVALVPADADAQRLAVDGGEPVDQLHCTLLYLGEAADIPDDARTAIVDRLRAAVADVTGAGYDAPVTADGFAVSLFNPGDVNDREPCIVLGLSGDDLDTVHGMVADSVREVESEPAGFTVPDQHAPWVPHVTLVYTGDAGVVSTLVDRVGPVTFDRIRVAFAGDNTDIPLGAAHDAPAPEGMPTAGAPAAVAAQTCKGAGLAGGEETTMATPAPAAPAKKAPAVKAGKKAAPPAAPADQPADAPVDCPPGWHPDDDGDCQPDDPNAQGCPDGWVPDDDGDCQPPAEQPKGTAAGSFAAPAPPPGKGAMPTPTPAPDGQNDCPDGQHPDPDTGDCVPDDDAAPAAQVEHFHTVVMEGVSTGMREFAPSSITWRDPPFAYHWQFKSSAHGGVPETVQVGIVTRAQREGSLVHFWGRLDLNCPEGVDYARRLVDGFAVWSSVSPDESCTNSTIEYLFPEGDGEDADPLAALFGDPEQMIFHDFRVAEITAVSVPALADADVEPTQELIDALAQMGVLTAAAVGAHKTGTSDGTWDGPANEKRLPAPMPVATARKAYAWIDDSKVDGGEVTKDACRFIHHEVGADGAPGAANTTACSTGIGVIHGGRGGTTIPDADRRAVYDHLAAHLRAAGQEPPDFDAGPIVAAGHIIEIPDCPPAWWFNEPVDVTPHGALTITDEGRIYGYLAPDGIAHRSFPGRRQTVPMGRVDYGRWMGGEAIVAGGGRVVAGPITMECGHLPPQAASASDVRMQHYDNACSVVAKARVGENRRGVWIAGALEPGVTADQVSRMLACRLSGDWAPHPERPGWREFVAALLVPVPGFPMARSAPSVRVAEGALVASAVPVRVVHRGADTATTADLRPALERVAQTIGRDAASRLAALRGRVHR